MSDYTQITDFSAKDALTAGDPNKLVKGSDLDGELAAIQTAIATKYDSADLASQAQAEAGTNNTTLMTPLRTENWFDNLSARSETKVKTGNETVNNSATLQADDDLASFTVDASGTYVFWGLLHCALKSASDFKCAMVLASAPTEVVMNVGGHGGTMTDDYDGQDGNSDAAALTVSGDDDPVLIFVEGIIVNDADGTTATFQWAQNTAVAEDTILRAGSFITMAKVA